jgi:hypothetical protein
VLGYMVKPEQYMVVVVKHYSARNVIEFNYAMCSIFIIRLFQSDS